METINERSWELFDDEREKLKQELREIMGE